MEGAIVANKICTHPRRKIMHGRRTRSIATVNPLDKDHVLGNAIMLADVFELLRVVLHGFCSF
jgi:hypothetical protein